MSQTVSASLDSNVAYVTGTVNGVSVTWTQMTTTLWQAVCDSAEDNTYVVYIEAITTGGETFSKTFTLFYGLNLIYDRTSANVQRVKYLLGLWQAGEWTGTADELTEFWASPKGAYNASDLNRVEGAVNYLCGLLQAAPDELEDYAAGLGVAWTTIFDLPYDADDYSLTTKLDWTEEDIPTVEDMTRYLANVETLTGAIEAAYPTLPDSMTKLTYTGANNIERALLALYNALNIEKARITALLDNTAASFVYCGQPYSGQIWTSLEG